MLIQVPVSRHSDKTSLLDEFDPNTMTWLVADLTSKSEIQLHLLKRHGVLPEDSVLRASELWGKIFQKLYPSWRLVSHDFLRSQLAEFLKKQKHSFASTPGAAKTLMTYMQQLLPVLADPNGEEQLQAWFGENPSAVIRWGHWNELSQRAWAELNEMQIITGTWCSGLLGHHEGFSSAWDRTIYSDLGCQINSVEASLLKSLSEITNVHVYQPENSWTRRYSKTLNAYDLFSDKADAPEERLPPLPVPKSTVEHEVEVHRYSTMVTEVKAVVAELRKDLESGIPAEELALIAPDIEVYWPVLHLYLTQEGIPFQKNVVARLQTFSDVDIWLARLRLAMGKVSSHDLERASFGGETQVRSLSFEKFKRLFSIVYDSADLDRWKDIKTRFESQKTESEKLLAHEFLVWISSHWPDNDNTDHLARLIKKIYTESPLNISRELISWMDLLENLAAKEEMSIQAGVAGGVHCLNVQEASWVPLKARYFLGLSADALRSQEATGLLFGDVQKIHNDLGYILMWPDKAHLEFETLWLLQSGADKTHLGFSATDFGGSILAPSMIWLQTAFQSGRDVEELSLPPETRWDQIQRSDAASIAGFRLWSKQHAETLEQSIRQDLGDLEAKTFGADIPWTLSASQLENYLTCPFQFAAGKIFGLSDEPDLDLDVDHMSRGKMMHKLFEWLTETKPFRSDWSDEELEEMVDRLPAETKIPLADRRLWPSTRKQYLDLAKRFLKREAELREEFPELHTEGRELEITANWSQEKKSLVSCEEEGIPFKGYIDRVDLNASGQSVIVDYKSQDKSERNYRSWLEKDQLQLGLYSMAYENGLTKLKAAEVIGAFYYSARTMEREKGFRVDERVGTLFGDNKPNKSHISLEAKRELFEGLNEKVSEVVDSMKQGLFPAEPKETKTCPICAWKSLCRAPHLNS